MLKVEIVSMQKQNQYGESTRQENLTGKFGSPTMRAQYKICSRGLIENSQLLIYKCIISHKFGTRQSNRYFLSHMITI